MFLICDCKKEPASDKEPSLIRSLPSQDDKSIEITENVIGVSSDCHVQQCVTLTFNFLDIIPTRIRERCRLNICSYIGWIDKY